MARPQARSAGKSAAITATTGSPLPPPGDERALYVVDMSGYVFRAYHALPPLSNSKGEPTGAVYGFTQMLNLLMRERKPAYLAIAMDSKKRGVRYDMYAEYKANRVAPPEDLSQQMARCEEIVRAYQVPIYRVDGVEADDLIAALAKKMRTQGGMKMVVVSSDKDMMQLVGPDLVLWETMRNKVYGVPEVTEKFGVSPDKLRDVLALMGDSSDNVPGVPSVGPKTASDLINQYGSVEGIYQHIDEIKRPKLREALVNHREDAMISQKLVTLQEDEPIEFDLEKLKYAPPRGEVAQKLRQLFIQLEFTRLVDQIDVRGPITRSYRPILTRAELEAFAARVRELGPEARLAVQVMATSERPTEAKLCGVGLAVDPGQGFYVPIMHRYLGAPQQVSLNDVREVLGPIFADAAIPKVGHDLKFTIEILRVSGMELRGLAFDVLLASYLLDPEAPNALKDLANAELGVQMASYDKITHKDALRRGHQLAFDEVPIEDAVTYAAETPAIVRDLADKLATRIDAEGMTSLLRDVELPLTEVLADVELTGVKIDVNRMKALTSEVNAQLESIEERARKCVREAYAGRPDADQHARDFNCGSPKQIETILFDVLKLPVLKRTKTSRSTDADVLEELTDKHELPGVVLEHRVLHKLKGTYLEALPRLISPKTGRLHTTFAQHVAATGRLSSVDPNLQNIPIRTEIGRRIREAFVAPEGASILSADYSQIELRILAHLSHDPILIDAFQKNEDIHTRTAREIFLDGDATATPNREMRTRAKAVNFGVVYGQGENALAKSLGIPREEAGRFIARYFERYAGVRRYMDEQIEIARRGEGVHTLLGRRRFLADIHSPNRALRMAAERIARNTPIQGTAADVLKLAMVALREPPVPGAKMLLTVHDELVFEIPKGREEEAAAIIRAKMSGVAKLDVPLVVDVGWGETWADAHG
ncbi:MAG: DNA polymerase I [Polyangiales bacterium]